VLISECLLFYLLKQYKSPVKEGYGDRFIPLRSSKAVWHINFDGKSVCVLILLSISVPLNAVCYLIFFFFIKLANISSICFMILLLVVIDLFN